MATFENSHFFIKELNALIESSSLPEDIDSNIIIEQLKENEEFAKNNDTAVKKLFDDVSKVGKVKIVEADVPSGILPEKCSGIIFDARIGGFGPDDKIYCANEWIRKNVTRGMAFLKLEGETKYFDLVIYGNKKFMGGIGDEDHVQPENNDVWKKFCLQNPENASHIICMSKINGEAGHISGRLIGNEFYWIIGSKNVHMIIKTSEDIEKYDTPRYGIAKIVAAAAMKLLDSLSNNQLNVLKHIFEVTKMTAVCELTQPGYQHIVDLSLLSEPIINFLMFTATVGRGRNDSFTALPPQYGLVLGKMIGFTTAAYESISVDEVFKQIDEVRDYKDTEGEVFYYVTSDLKTIGLAKVKSGWYIMLRALREKADYFLHEKRKDNLTMDEKIASCKKRFKQIQSWLNFGNEYLKSWSELGENFLRWSQQEVSKGTLDTKKLRPEFPIIWERYLRCTGSSDRIKFR